MRNVLRVLAMSAALFALVAVAGFAQTDTGSLTLTGNVPANVDVTINAVQTSFALDQDVSNVQVATVAETSNIAAGYDVTLESANAVAAGAGSAFFEHASAGDTLNYTLTYGGSAVNFTSGVATVTDSTSTAFALSKSLNISFSGASANLTSGSYDDTLTFTITAK